MPGKQTLHICLVDCGSDKTPDITFVLEQRGYTYDLLKIGQANEASFALCDGMIISGGPILFTDGDKGRLSAARFGFLDSLTIPVLGICLGHQAIGIRHGVKAFLGKERRKADIIRIVEDHPLVTGIKSGTIFVKDHCEGIPLPKNFVRIGSSEYYDVEIMAHRQKPFYGVQFHPESSGEPGRMLFNNFFGLIEREALHETNP